MLWDRDRIAQALTYDIELISARRHRPGWTPWALLAAGAAAAWALLTTLETSTPKGLAVATWSIALIAGADAIASIRTFFIRTVPPRERTHRFLFANATLGADRFQILYVIFHSSTILLLVAVYRSAFPALFVCAAAAWYSLGCVISLATFVLSFFGLPIAAAPDSHVRGRIISVALLVPVIGIASGVAVLAFRERATIEPLTLKVAGLILALQLVAELLCTSSREPPLIAALVNIRRRLLLGEAAPPDALAEIEVTTLGLRASDVLQTRIRTLLRLQEDMRSHLRNGIDDLTRFRTLLGKAEGATAEELAAAQRAVEAAVRRHGDQARAALRTYGVEWQKLVSRVRWLNSIAPRHEAAIEPVMSKLTIGFESVQGELESFSQAALDALPPAEPTRRSLP